MKKILFLTAFIATATFSQSKAQHFIASFGVERSWSVPDYLSDIVYDTYWDYDWVHATRVMHHGVMTFDILLQRGNTFISVNIGPSGHYRTVARFSHYPLAGHICNEFCGYHDYYYSSYYQTCHSHTHFGHNHIVYRPRPVRYVYGSYRTLPRYNRPNRTVIVQHNQRNDRNYKEVRRQRVYREPSKSRTARVENRNQQKRSYETQNRTSVQRSASPTRRGGSVDVKAGRSQSGVRDSGRRSGDVKTSRSEEHAKPEGKTESGRRYIRKN